MGRGINVQLPGKPACVHPLAVGDLVGQERQLEEPRPPWMVERPLWPTRDGTCRSLLKDGMVVCAEHAKVLVASAGHECAWPPCSQYAPYRALCPYHEVRHEAPHDQVGGRSPPPACRSRPVKLGAA